MKKWNKGILKLILIIVFVLLFISGVSFLLTSAIIAKGLLSAPYGIEGLTVLVSHLSFSYAALDQQLQLRYCVAFFIGHIANIYLLISLLLVGIKLIKVVHGK